MRKFNFSFVKLLNFFQLNISYLLSVVTKRVFIWGFPYRVGIEPVNFCNLACSACECGQGVLNRRQESINIGDYKLFLEKYGRYLITIQLFGQGEPFLCRDLNELIQLAKQYKIFTTTSTNGHFLSVDRCQEIIKSGLDEIIIALDGTNQEIYEKYRSKGSFQLVLDGIVNLMETKKRMGSKKPEIALQFLVFRHNQFQINEFKKIAKNLGINLIVLKSAQLTLSGDIFQIPEGKYAKYSRYFQLGDGKYQLKKRVKYCYRLWSSVSFLSNGDAVVCCYDKKGEKVMGKISDITFIEKWRSEPYNSFRYNILRDMHRPEICNNCIG